MSQKYLCVLKKSVATEGDFSNYQKENSNECHVLPSMVWWHHRLVTVPVKQPFPGALKTLLRLNSKVCFGHIKLIAT